MAICNCLLCGKDFDIPNAWIKKGGGKYCSKSCAVESQRKQNVNTPTYFSWKSMKSRCDNPNHPSYQRYGGRGITYCERWTDFQSFLEDMGERPEGTTIGRIDNDGNYLLQNCRWETPEQQANNRSNNRIVEVFGNKETVANAAKKTGIDRCTLEKRIDAGDEGNNLFREKKGRIAALAREHGINPSTIAWRLKAGWPMSDAIKQVSR